jgi:1-acyl-sn-glycerol-3-phosphate acyltransferase
VTSLPAAAVLRLAVRFITSRNLRVSLEGAEHLPKYGPALIVAHRGHPFYDSIALLDALPRLPRLIVGIGWLQNPTLRSIAIAACDALEWPAALHGEHLYDHETGAMQQGAALLQRGDMLAAYTEGSAATNAEFVPQALLTMLDLAQADAQTRVPILPAGFAYVRDGDVWNVIIRFGAALSLYPGAERPALLEALVTRGRALSAGVAGVA